jgi:hypothetical protein
VLDSLCNWWEEGDHLVAEKGIASHEVIEELQYDADSVQKNLVNLFPLYILFHPIEDKLIVWLF